MNSNVLAVLGAAAISAVGGIAAYGITANKPNDKVDRVETRQAEPCNAQPTTKIVVKGDGEAKLELDLSTNW